jgi:methyl-accepting chemotaxis protein
MALALVAAGCGGGDDGPEASATDEWAESFCTAVSTWRTELDQIVEGVSPTSESIEQAVEDASDATDSFLDELRDLGGPDTESGDEIESAVDAFSDTVETEKASVEEAVEDVDDLSGIAGAASAVSTSVSTMAAALQTAIQTIENADVEGEVRTALENTPACDQLDTST